MKKTTITITLLSVILLGCISTTPIDNEGIERIIEIEGKNSEEIFIMLNDFLASYINDARASIEFSDKEGGKIIGDVRRAGLVSIYTNETRTNFNYNIAIKDEKAKIVIKTSSFLVDPIGPDFEKEYTTYIKYPLLGIDDAQQHQSQKIAFKAFFDALETHIDEYSSEF